MKLRLKKGAVVKVELIGAGEPIFKMGKVENVFDDEIVLVEQIAIESESNELDFWFDYKYDKTKTIDGKKFHVNRALIASWEYASITTVSKTPIPKPDLSKATYTYYDSDGYCYGDGIDFSDIPDSSSKYIVVGSPEDDSEGLELTM